MHKRKNLIETKIVYFHVEKSNLFQTNKLIIKYPERPICKDIIIGKDE